MSSEQVESLTIVEFEHWWTRANPNHVTSSSEWAALQAQVVRFLRQVEQYG